jgi:hypothetical protein
VVKSARRIGPARLSANASARTEDASSHWDIIDRDHQRRLGAHRPETTEHAERDGATVVGCARGPSSQQCHLKRAPLRRRCVRERLVEDFPENVAEARVGQMALALSRPGHQNPESGRGRHPDSREPQRGLADACLTLEQKGTRQRRLIPDELGEDGEFGSAADDVDVCHLAPHGERDRVIIAS